MSWKSLVTTGLLCVLASPVFAAPNMAIVKGGTQGVAVDGNNLDAAGNWVWNVQITPDLGAVPDASGTPVAAELGFSSTSSGAAANQGNVISATNMSSGAGNLFDTINPGAVIFGPWQNATNGLLDANSNNRPTGIQLNAPGVGTNAGSSYTTNSSVSGTANQVFAALGSVNFTSAGAQNFIQIKTQRPVVTPGNVNTSTKIQVSGVYGTGSTNGRLTQVTGLTGTTYTTSNFDTFGGNSYSFTRNARGGDANLDGTIDGADYNALLLSFNGTGKTWYHADFDGTGVVDGADYNFILTAFGQNYVVGPTTPGAGSGGGLSSSSVPEPASIAMVGLAMLGGLGIIRRKR
jgi:hypothetical protein